MKVIGFMGLAGAGKTTAAMSICEASSKNCKILSFATPLKSAVQELFLLSYDQIYGSREMKEAVDPRWEKSPRQIMQIIGTDCIRNMIKADFWVCRMRELIKHLAEKDPNTTVIIDDVRFQDEALLIHEFGGENYNIARPGGQTLPWHASENPPVDYARETIFNTRSLSDYKTMIRHIFVDGGRV